MRKQLYYTLNNTAALTAIVGDRIYPQRVPKSDATPYVVFVVSGSASTYQQDGYTGYKKVTVDISCVGSSIAECQSVADEVFIALNITNTQIGDTGDKIDLDAIYLETESDDFFLFDGSEDGVRTIDQTYTINYR